jgi:hypothetical protein
MSLRPRSEFRFNFSVWCFGTFAFLLLTPFTVSGQIMPDSRSLSGAPQQDGTIKGVVTDNEGAPVEGADICIQFKDERGGSTSTCGGQTTDGQGKISIGAPLGVIGVEPSS